MGQTNTKRKFSTKLKEEPIMNVSREIKKAEAINRMKELGLFAPCIKAFKRDEVQLSEPTGGLYEFSNDKELTAKGNQLNDELAAAAEKLVAANKSYDQTVSAAIEKLGVEA